MLSEQYETSYLFYLTLSFLCNIISYLISVFVFSSVTLSGPQHLGNFVSIFFLFFVCNIFYSKILSFRVFSYHLSYSLVIKINSLSIYIYRYIYQSHHIAGYDLSSVFKWSSTGLNLKLSFFQTGFHTIVKYPSLIYYLSRAGGRLTGFIPFPKMQRASPSIWTRVAVSIYIDDNHYTTGTPKCMCACACARVLAKHSGSAASSIFTIINSM